MAHEKITIIDLNNFAHYPTLAVGYLMATLRNGGYNVKLFSPLMKGVKSREREYVESKIDYYKKRIFLSENKLIQGTYYKLKSIPGIKELYDNRHGIYRTIKNNIDLDTDLILISSYLHNYNICKKLCAFFKKQGIPVIIGGPGFNDTKVAREWIELDGVYAIIGSEVDSFLNELISSFFHNRSIAQYPGVITKTKKEMDTSYIFKNMDQLLVPDFSDFPWNKYPVRLIPYMTGRGCQWGRCTFCNDVQYVSGRTFRSAKTSKVLKDIKELTTRYRSTTIVFVDLKLNSDLSVWYALIENMKKINRDMKWIGTVHVDGRTDNGLSLDTLIKAKNAGLTRVSFGFESASQKLLNKVKKGTTVKRIIDFVTNVKSAGISLRGTMFVGYPYEDEEDLKLTLEFLKEYNYCFDRISIGYFQMYDMAPFYKDLIKSGKIIGEKIIDKPRRTPNYFKYKRQIIREVNKINSKALKEEAIELDGVM